MDNYRPKALTPVLSKIFVYCFLKRLLHFQENHKIFSEYQFGFKSSLSTIYAVYGVMQTVVCGIESGKCPPGIFCDLSKAFNCVSHELLMVELKNLGIRERALRCIADYSHDRVQCVLIRPNVDGYPRIGMRHIQIGVPQGSYQGLFSSFYIKKIYVVF